MHDQPPRIDPIMPAAWNDTVLDALGAFPRSLEFVWSRWKGGEAVPRGTHVLGTMAHHPALAKAFMTFNAHVAGASTLPVRVRELAILRLSWLRYSEYEFAQHVILGLRAGLTNEEVTRVQHGPEAAGWDRLDADLVRAVDELNARARIEPPTWERLAKAFSHQQLMDLVFLIGCYEMLAMAINTFGIQMEPGLEALAPEVKARMLGTATR
jgi:4-carboxymuconolactone decarboxylase